MGEHMDYAIIIRVVISQILLDLGSSLTRPVKHMIFWLLNMPEKAKGFFPRSV